MKISPSLAFPSADINRSLSKAELASHVKTIALRALKELALALIMTAISIPFIASSSVSLMTMGIAVSGIALIAAIHFTSLCMIKHNRMPWTRSLCGYIFNAANPCPPVLMHECGHFGAATLFFQGKHRMQIHPFNGGLTKFYVSKLTSLGQKIGYRNSIFLITLAGTALALTAASVALIAGLSLRRSHPTASSYLIGAGILPFFHHASYALSTFSASPNNLGHDFMRLWTFGIHPLAALTVIVAIPVIIFLSSILLRKLPEPTFQPALA
jgi:hypothetical protein